jgi:ferredoxin
MLRLHIQQNLHGLAERAAHAGGQDVRDPHSHLNSGPCWLIIFLERSQVMANPALRLPENVPGDFFVDSTCIDCDACRQIAPETFSDAGDASIVYRQPLTEGETKRALMALVACPTASIGTSKHHDAQIGIDSFPSPIAENIFFLWLHRGIKLWRVELSDRSAAK